METEIISAIRAELLQQADEKARSSAQTFFKESAKFYGVKSAVVSRIAAEYYRQIKHYDKQVVFTLCEALLQSDYSEEAFIAFEWSYRLRDKYEPGDFILLEKWLNKYVNNWAKCDVLCNHTIGAFIEKYPQYIDDIRGWARQDNRWLRRASAVSLIIPARKGKFLEEIFAIADILLHDEDDLVRKGYGWMLKEASRQHQKEVFNYVVRNKATMPRTALRYAIEKMPEDLRRQAMVKD